MSVKETLFEKINGLQVQTQILKHNAIALKDTIKYLTETLEALRKAITSMDRDICVLTTVVGEVLLSHYTKQEIDTLVKRASERVDTDKEFAKIMHNFKFTDTKETKDGENK